MQSEGTSAMTAIPSLCICDDATYTVAMPNAEANCRIFPGNDQVTCNGKFWFPMHSIVHATV